MNKKKFRGTLFFMSLAISTMVEESQMIGIEDAYLVSSRSTIPLTYWKKVTGSLTQVFISHLNLDKLTFTDNILITCH